MLPIRLISAAYAIQDMKKVIAEAFFVSPSRENGGEGPYNRSIGPEEATVRNKEDLSGTASRRASPPGS